MTSPKRTSIAAGSPAPTTNKKTAKVSKPTTPRGSGATDANGKGATTKKPTKRTTYSGGKADPAGGVGASGGSTKKSTVIDSSSTKKTPTSYKTPSNSNAVKPAAPKPKPVANKTSRPQPQSYAEAKPTAQQAPKAPPARMSGPSTPKPQQKTQNSKAVAKAKAEETAMRKAEEAAVRKASKGTPTKSMANMTKSDVKEVKMSALPKGTVQKPPRMIEMDYKTGKPMAQAKMQAKRKTTGRKSRK